MTLLNKIFSSLILITLAGGAHANVYKCVDSNGRITYTNDQNLVNNDCTRLSEDLPVSSIPPPDYITNRPSAPAAPAAKQPASPNSFPRVTPSAQRERDGTRRQILEQELTQEQASLEKAKAALAEQEAVRYGNERNYQKVLDRLQPFQAQVELHSRNIEALQREIGNLK